MCFSVMSIDIHQFNIVLLAFNLLVFNTSELMSQSDRHLRRWDSFLRGRLVISPKSFMWHDNYKYATRVIKDYFQWQEEPGVLQQMVQPPWSPDLKIIVSVWYHMKRQKRNKTGLIHKRYLCKSVPIRSNVGLNVNSDHTKHWFHIAFFTFCDIYAELLK